MSRPVLAFGMLLVLAGAGCAESASREARDSGRRATSTAMVDAGVISLSDVGILQPELGDLCDDGIDNDGNTFVDCADLSCRRAPNCARDSGPVYIDGALACETVGVTGELESAPVDVIWLIDNSLSMLNDTLAVQNGLMQFANSLLGAELDYQIVVVNEPLLVGAPPWDAAALGLDPSRFHPISAVLFNDCLGPALSTVEMWRGFLRPDSVVHFIAVTDDNSGVAWDQFYSDMRTALGDRDFTMHAVVSPPDMGCVGATRGGDTYWQGAQATGGERLSICAPDWSPVFTALQSSITSTAVLPCEYGIPDPPQGSTYDRSLVNVEHVINGVTTGFPRRMAESECGAELGWFYDDLADPTQILLCPTACDQLESQGGTVNVAFVCDEVQLY